MMNTEKGLHETATDESASSVTVFVCTSCGCSEKPETLGKSDGLQLFSELKAMTSAAIEINISPVECLAVCEKPVTIAFASSNKWTYIIGNVDPQSEIVDIICVARAIAKSRTGILSMEKRPPFFQEGVVSRMPPLCLQSKENHET
jgi:predicted metal-binding protein